MPERGSEWYIIYGHPKSDAPPCQSQLPFWAKQETVRGRHGRTRKNNTTSAQLEVSDWSACAGRTLVRPLFWLTTSDALADWKRKTTKKIISNSVTVADHARCSDRSALACSPLPCSSHVSHRTFRLLAKKRHDSGKRMAHIYSYRRRLQKSGTSSRKCRILPYIPTVHVDYQPLEPPMISNL